jgi:orotidine-5'-phosphate decarboxylase
VAELILALDRPDPDSARAMVERIPELEWVKIGSVLFTRGGPPLVAWLRDRGHRVFLDLKWHDIPNTVRGAVANARAMGVSMVTVHTLGGRAMLEAARDAAGFDLHVVGVTVLTSHDLVGYTEAVGRRPAGLAEEAVRLATLARSAGLDGVVCSPLEAAALRATLGPDALLVTPGIRAAGAAAGDQARVATAAAAVQAGASHLVVGRPVLEAADPGLAWAALRAEVAG